MSSPRVSKIAARDADAMPFPSEDTTPPVVKIYRVIVLTRASHGPGDRVAEGSEIAPDCVKNVPPHCAFQATRMDKISQRPMLTNLQNFLVGRDRRSAIMKGDFGHLGPNGVARLNILARQDTEGAKTERRDLAADIERVHAALGKRNASLLH